MKISCADLPIGYSFLRKLSVFDNYVEVLWCILPPMRYLEYGLSLLDAHEKERAQSIRDRFSLMRFVWGRALLRLILAERLHVTVDSIVFSYKEYGKPYLNIETGNKSLKFNISHSGEYLAFALTEKGEVGIDLELVRPRKGVQKILAALFSSQDYSWVCADNHTINYSRFYTLWCRREALLKALGCGARYPTHAIHWSELCCDLTASYVELSLSGIKRILMVQDLMLLEGYCAALALCCTE